MNLDIPTPKVFEPLLGKARYKGAHGGRGSGKSHHFAEAVVERCIEQPGTRIVCVREVQRSLKESVKRLVEDKIIAFGVGPMFRVLTDSIIAPGNGIILFQGMQDHTAESIKSLEGFNVAYVEEAQTLTERSLEMLRPTIRADGSELWFSWNPRHAADPVDKLLRGENPPPDACVVSVNYDDNPFFPAELEIERIFDQQHRFDRYGHVWLGEYEPTAVGAIWTREIIHRNRIKEAPEMQRIVVSIDPPITNEPGSDEAGIIVVGLGGDGNGYVLGDHSQQGAPKQWGERAIAAYDTFDADAIVAEVNQGGDMVAHVIHSARPDIRVIEVRATRGKHVRAEPISSLYALDRIKHVGAYPELEGQMCLMTAAGFDGEGSPDRVDAMVWGFTELFPKLTRRGKPQSGKARPDKANNRYNVHKAHARGAKR
jgi:phage terminase large subunit-like protein